MNLRQKTFSAVRWTTLDSLSKAFISITSIAILARILKPEDYGLMAMVSVVLGIATLFADLGVNSAYVQRKNVSQEQRSSLFWLNITMSVILLILFIALSPFIAQFFNDARLSPLMMLSATTLVFAALGQQVKMSAAKELQFRLVVVADIIAGLIGLGTAIIAAYSGWGVYSLVFSGIVTTTLATIFYWVFVARGWRPICRLQLEDIKPFFGFGGTMVLSDLLNYISLKIDVLLGGRLLGVAELGLYSIPRNLVLQLSGVVNPIITRVGFPLIAKVQSDVPQVKKIYLQTINMTAATNAPLYVGLAFFAPEIVATVLGPGWERSGELLRILSLWGGLRSTANPIGSLTYGMGRAGLSLNWNLVKLLILPPLVWIGSWNGPEGIALALLVIQVLLFVPAWYFLVRPLCEAKFLEFSMVALRPFVLAGLAVTPAFALASQFDSEIIRLTIGIVISAPLYFGLSFVGNRGWIEAMLELTGYSKLLAKGI